jgi:hypothetical protein
MRELADDLTGRLTMPVSHAIKEYSLFHSFEHLCVPSRNFLVEAITFEGCTPEVLDLAQNHVMHDVHPGQYGVNYGTRDVGWATEFMRFLEWTKGDRTFFEHVSPDGLFRIGTAYPKLLDMLRSDWRENELVTFEEVVLVVIAIDHTFYPNGFTIGEFAYATQRSRRSLFKEGVQLRSGIRLNEITHRVRTVVDDDSTLEWVVLANELGIVLDAFTPEMGAAVVHLAKTHKVEEARPYLEKGVWDPAYVTRGIIYGIDPEMNDAFVNGAA